MSWTPTTGMLRAELTVQMLEADAPGCGFRLDNATFRWRMVQIIAGAIDSALHDGPKADAVTSIIPGNGIAPRPNSLGQVVAASIGWKNASAGVKEGDAVTITNGPHAGEYVAGTPIKARGRPKKGAKRKAKAKRSDPVTVQEASEEHIAALIGPSPKKRGRPSKADVAARAEAEAKEAASE